MVTLTMNDPDQGAQDTDAAQRGSQAQRPAGPNTVTDSKGRKLLLRELTLLEEQDLIAAMGIEHSSNQFVLTRSLFAARVAEIDGERVTFPVTKTLYRAMLQRVGHEGLEAVFAAAKLDGEATQEETVELAKN